MNRISLFPYMDYLTMNNPDLSFMHTDIIRSNFPSVPVAKFIKPVNYSYYLTSYLQRKHLDFKK